MSLENFLSKNRDKKIVFTNGCFDLLHLGHLKYLEEARSLGDVLIIGLNSDSSVKELKGESRPIKNETERKAFMMALKFVDYVEVFSEQTPLNLIKKILPSVLVKGGDWAIEDIVGSQEVIANGGEVKSLTFLDGYSTTALIEKIKNEI